MMVVILITVQVHFRAIRMFGVSSILWAWGKRGCMLRQAPLHEFKEQELSNTLWAVSSLGLADTQIPALFTREALARGLDAFSAQGVANYMWACASLGYRDDNFIQVRILGYALIVANCMRA